MTPSTVIFAFMVLVALAKATVAVVAKIIADIIAGR